MEQKKPKALKDLNLLDRFLFSEVMEDPGTCQAVLEIILGKDIQLKESVQSEKELRTLPTFRGIRMDVWSQDEEDCIYNAEMQGTNKKNHPRRSRYYQFTLDAGLLEPGVIDFNKLNNVYLIMIAPFDLFGQNRCVYTFRMRCDQDPALSLDDGAVRMFYTPAGNLVRWNPKSCWNSCGMWNTPMSVRPAVSPVPAYRSSTTGCCRLSKMKESR